MEALYKIPLEPKSISLFLEEEKDFLIGLLQLLGEINEGELNEKTKLALTQLKEKLPEFVERIFPPKDFTSQIIALQSIAQILSQTVGKTKFSKIGVRKKWISIGNGYLGRIVDEQYEIAILLYLVAAVYQTRALAKVQTSPQYRYYHISSLAALLSAIEYIEQLNPDLEEHYAKPFYQMLQLRKLEVAAEVTKSEAFLARKQGDFEKASKLFAGAASYRFSMMNFDLPEDSDNRVKIFASTELGMACFYVAVGLSNKSESEQAYYYLLKAKGYFENATKLSENNTELLEAANKRLDLVNPYIDRIKDTIEEKPVELEKIPDPQPLMVHIEPKPIMNPKDEEIMRICSNCTSKIKWTDKCPECGEHIIPLE
ncbi:MAG TPA: hypothetical protein VMX55_14650 [candidate division Zixibacteria bacterium]|nr:hypothetical protein [candidate division Zixibacteria bacterium]